MNIALQIIVITLPSVIIAVSTYFLIRSFLNNEQKKLLIQLKQEKTKEGQKQILPLKIQAYERLALFLERINPSGLVLRCFVPGMALNTLQAALTKSIRDEFEHNLSQQIFISPELWNRIKAAKEDMVNLVNSSAIDLPQNADPSELAGKIFLFASNKELSSETALRFLKAEFEELV